MLFDKLLLLMLLLGAFLFDLGSLCLGGGGYFGEIQYYWTITVDTVGIIILIQLKEVSSFQG